MFAILPFISFAVLIFGLRRSGFGWRKSLLAATIPWSLFVAYSTEILSTFHGITRLGLSAAWLVCAVLAAAWAAWVWRKPRVIGDEAGTSSLDGWDKAALAFIGVLVAIAALTALVSTPNTWDAMEYHMPRVVQWIGNRGVQFYPTIDRQQLTMPPLSEYTMMHMEALFGSDRLVNLVQWFGYLGSIVGVSLVAKELGASRRTQIFTAVLGTAIPLAIMSASGAKNDNVLAYWTVVTVYLLLLWRREQNVWLALGIGASISLTVFTKGTGYVFLPCLIAACWIVCDGRAKRRMFAVIPVTAVLILTVCGPFWMRNYEMSGSVLGLPYFDGAGSIDGRRFANSNLRPAQVVAGVVRNVAINAAVPSRKVNACTTRLCSNLMWTIGVNPSDPGQIYRAQSGAEHPFRVEWHVVDETLAANQWNLLLFLVAWALYLTHLRTRNKADGWLSLGVIGSFVMFSALLRWGPWNGRYQIPLVTLSVVFVALVFSQYLPLWANRTIGFALLTLTVPIAMMNSSRSWVAPREMSQTLFKLPRSRTYFLDKHNTLGDSFLAAANAPEVKNCQTVGLDVRLQHFEYPMMALIQMDDPGAHFRYMAVDNPTAAYADPKQAPPCVVVCLGCAKSQDKQRLYGANARTEVFGDIAVFSNHGNPVAVNQLSHSISQ